MPAAESPNPPEDSPILDSFLSQSLKTREYQLIPLAGDASSKKYFRVIQKNHSYVLMIWDSFDAAHNNPFLNILEHFTRNRVRVPKVISHDHRQGLTMLEDLGDLTLEKKFWEKQSQDHILPFYEQAVSELIKIHYSSSEDKGSCVAFDNHFDTNSFFMGNELH